jgi:hypothetical protein
MEMRSHLVASGDSGANLQDKMSYGESRTELIDTFGSRKVQYQFSTFPSLSLHNVEARLFR